MWRRIAQSGSRKKRIRFYSGGELISKAETGAMQDGTR